MASIEDLGAMALARSGKAKIVTGADNPAPPAAPGKSPGLYWTVRSVLSVPVGIAGAYHGYKRNDSGWWAFGWWLFSGALPEIALPVMLAQGFGKPEAK